MYTIRLSDRLPEIEIPLSSGDPAVRVELQPVFERCYDAGPHSRRLRYDPASSNPPLGCEEFEWATRLLRETGHLASA